MYSLIAYLVRKTNNERKFIVKFITKEEIKHIYEWIDMYHCENKDKIVDEQIIKGKIKKGNFDNVVQCVY